MQDAIDVSFWNPRFRLLKNAVVRTCAVSFYYVTWTSKCCKAESIATWLILPVVIRSSQRLSHACVSINKFLLWNCERLIISVIVYLIIFDYWITVVILELIHAQSPDCLGGMYLLDNNQQFVLSHDNLADRIWRQIIQVSALSAFDGSVLDYHGIHG